jgi:hypothetical protein
LAQAHWPGTRARNTGKAYLWRYLTQNPVKLIWIQMAGGSLDCPLWWGIWKMTAPNFDQVFAKLRDILKPYEPRCTVVADKPGHYYLNSGYSEKWKKELMFAAAEIKKNYVSFYLFPVYMFPDLLDGLSDGLKKRMQGKSCFNFKTVDELLLAELAALTQKGIERFRQENLVTAQA